MIVTRQSNYTYGELDLSDAKIVSSLEKAIEVCEEDACPFIVGGAQIYELAMPKVTQIFLTRVHATVDGDTKLPSIEWSNWELEAVERFESDEKNDHPYSFEDYRRK